MKFLLAAIFFFAPTIAIAEDLEVKTDSASESFDFELNDLRYKSRERHG